MNFQPHKQSVVKKHFLFLWVVFLYFISMACSLTDNSAQPSAVPTSPIAVDRPLNAIPAEENKTLDQPTASSSTTCTVNATVLHLRTCAGIDCPVEAWLLQGESLTIIQPGTSWIKVTTPSGQTGWVNTTYCGGK